jgi:geranylgeranyl pyrophosphate synthase
MNAPKESRADLLPGAIEVMKRTGALEQTHEIATSYIDSAIRCLDDIPPSESLDSLLALSEYVQARNH